MSQAAYVAIRRGEDGTEWMQLDTLTLGHEVTESRAKAYNKEAKDWAKVNRLLRIAKVVILEV